MDQIAKYLQKDFGDSELTKVRQTVIPEVYLMLESFMEASRLFAVDKNCEVFFSVFYQLVFFPAINFTDKFKIFLEERYITVVMKRLPEALARSSATFRDYFLRFACRVMGRLPDNSMVNVILCNVLPKLADIFHGCKVQAVRFAPGRLATVCRALVGLMRTASDLDYTAMVKASKNSRELVWLAAARCYLALVESLFTDGNIDAGEAAALMDEFCEVARQTRAEALPTLALLKADSLRELAHFILLQPKVLQTMIIFASQLQSKPDEGRLLLAMEEVKAFESFLAADPCQYFSADLECRNLVDRHSKNLLETNHRIMAAVCSDPKKAAQAYRDLVAKYCKTFDEYLRLPHRGQSPLLE